MILTFSDQICIQLIIVWTFRKEHTHTAKGSEYRQKQDYCKKKKHAKYYEDINDNTENGGQAGT